MSSVQRNRTHVKARPALAVLLLLLSAAPFLSGAVEAAWRGVSAAAVRRHYRHWSAMETEYFHMRFSEDDRELAVRIGLEADRVVREVAKLIPHDTAERPWLIIVPDQETMKQAFGWGDGTGALGVYLADTVKVLSPRAWEWENENERLALFLKQGPLVHEYTHYVLDAKTGGNYPRWFSEGFSQLAEYHILGYEWLESSSSLASSRYSLLDLERTFDKLPDQALAYRQALSMVTFLESLQGMAGLNRFIGALERGAPFYRALEQVYGTDRTTFAAWWHQWHSADNRWFQSR